MAEQPSPLGFCCVNTATSRHECVGAEPLQPCSLGAALVDLASACPDLLRLACTNGDGELHNAVIPQWIVLRLGLQLLHPDPLQEWDKLVVLHVYDTAWLAPELPRTVNHTHFQQLATVVRARVVSNSGQQWRLRVGYTSLQKVVTAMSGSFTLIVMYASRVLPVCCFFLCSPTRECRRHDTQQTRRSPVSHHQRR